MSTILIVVAAVVVVVIAAAALVVQTMQRRNRLRRQFGPEYDRAVEVRGDRREAERELRHRQERIEHMELRPLEPAARQAYRADWAQIQERFVDTPRDALTDADQLIRRVMADRGYEVQDYGQRVADLSVEHARTLEHYRAAHDITTANTQVSTEDLRQAMVHYRTLFNDLLERSDTAAKTGTPESPTRNEDRNR
jgi:hypothetical protein